MQSISLTGPPVAPARRYERLFELACGGMGTVYVGRRLGPGGFQRLVAMKSMHASFAADPENVAAFRDEAHLASLVQHANVVAIHDVCEENGEPFLVMDYVDGPSLAALLGALRSKGKRLARRVALRIVHDTLRGLDAAHELVGLDGRPLELVHRDATPHNILLGTDGIARLTDFGVARALARTGRTEPGCAKGKFAYMAPEQAFADAIDRRVDVFAMGVVLWETLTGHRLFANRTRNEAARGAALGDIAAPSTLAPGTPRELDRVVLRALSPWREDRYSTARAFADALLAFAAEDGGLAPASAVADVIEMACGDIIRARRERIRAALAGRDLDDAAARMSATTVRDAPEVVAARIGPVRLATPEAAAVDVPTEKVQTETRAPEPRMGALPLFVASTLALVIGIGVGSVTADGARPELARHLGAQIVTAVNAAHDAIAARLDLGTAACAPPHRR